MATRRIEGAGVVGLITAFQAADGTGTTRAVTTRRLQELLRFGGLMLSAGETAFRVRRSMGVIASGLGFESLWVQLGARNIIASGRRDGETATLVRDVAVPRVNTERIGALEALARCFPLEMSAREFATQLDSIEKAQSRYSISQTAAAVGAACGAFAFLNDASWIEVAACLIGGGLGQCLKSFLVRRRFNQYAVTALCAMVASALYCVTVAFGARRGLWSRARQCRPRIIGVIPNTRFSFGDGAARPVAA